MRRTVVGVALVKPTLRLGGYGYAMRLLRRLTRRSPRSFDQTRSMVNLAQRVMTRLPLHMTCLERSLVAWWLSGGEPEAQIRFGVQSPANGDTPRFHAWVELEGVVLDDDVEDISSYLPLTPPERSSQLRRFD